MGRGPGHRGRADRRRRHHGRDAEAGRRANTRRRPRGRFVSPGFNDAHVHIDATGALLTGVNLLDVHEPPFVERIRDATTRLPRGAGSCAANGAPTSSGAPAPRERLPAPAVRGRPFTPDRRMIDAVNTEHPGLREPIRQLDVPRQQPGLEGRRHHGGDPAPPGGEIVKDARGRLTGILKGRPPTWYARSSPDRLRAAPGAGARGPRRGPRGRRHDDPGPVLGRAGDGLPGAAAEGRAHGAHQHSPEALPGRGVAALGFSRGFGDDWLRLVGYKAWVDGIMGNSAALFFEPFHHDPRNRGTSATSCSPRAEGAAMTARPAITTPLSAGQHGEARQGAARPESRLTCTPSATSATGSCSTSTSGC